MRFLPYQFRWFSAPPPCGHSGLGLRALLLILPMLIVTMALAPGHAAAARADRNKPMQAEADALKHDDIAGSSVFTGNVLIKKGSLLLKGDKIELRQDALGYQIAQVYGTPDKKAYFKQDLDRPGESVEAQGVLLVYDGKSDELRISGQGVFRRKLKNQILDEVVGEKIVYNASTDNFTVDSSSAPAGTGRRVRITLAPKTPAAATGSSGSKK